MDAFCFEKLDSEQDPYSTLSLATNIVEFINMQRDVVGDSPTFLKLRVGSKRIFYLCTFAEFQEMNLDNSVP